MSTPETTILDERAVSEIEAQLADCTTVMFPITANRLRALCATVKYLRGSITQLQKWQGDVEEREAAVCPEDVGFDEYIRSLQSQLEQLRAWKESAMTLLSRYDNIAETFGGKLGSSKIDNLERGVEQLRAENISLTKERDRARDDLRILSKGRIIQS